MSRHRVFLGQISDCLNPHRDRIGFPLTPGVHAEATQIGLCLDHLILQGRLLYQTAQDFLLSYDDAIIQFAGQEGLGHMDFLQPIDLWCLRGVATAAPNENQGASETGAGAESSPQ